VEGGGVVVEGGGVVVEGGGDVVEVGGFVGELDTVEELLGTDVVFTDCKLELNGVLVNESVIMVSVLDGLVDSGSLKDVRFSNVFDNVLAELFEYVVLSGTIVVKFNLSISELFFNDVTVVDSSLIFERVVDVDTVDDPILNIKFCQVARLEGFSAVVISSFLPSLVLFPSSLSSLTVME